MRARLWTALLAAACMFAAQAASADPVGRYLYVAPMGGFTTFDGDFNWPEGHPLADKTYVDLNRCGTPLSEIVSELYLCSNDRRREQLWRRAETSLKGFGIDAAEQARISLR